MYIRLRPATIKDANILLEWKNDPTMRKFSIKTHDEIKLEDHLKWLEKHLSEIYIIEDADNLLYDGIAYGDIRFEGDEIAIKLDPKFRGAGIGSRALHLAMKMKKHLVAKIVNGNIASMNLFTSCGFKFKSYEDGYYVLEYNQ